MKTSASVTKITGALLEAQKEITFAPKDSDNPYFKSKYADLATVMSAVKGPLNNNDIVLIQTLDECVDGHVRITTRLQHESGEFFESTNSVPMVKMDAQAYGSAVTYSRRYAISAITGLYQDDDDGNAASAQPAKDSALPKNPMARAQHVASLSGPISPAKDIRNELPKAMQQQAASTASTIDTEFDLGDDELAFNRYAEIDDNEMKVAVWSYLPSKTRSTIKKMHSAKQEKKDAA